MRSSRSKRSHYQHPPNVLSCAERGSRYSAHFFSGVATIRLVISGCYARHKLTSLNFRYRPRPHHHCSVSRPSLVDQTSQKSPRTISSTIPYTRPQQAAGDTASATPVMSKPATAHPRPVIYALAFVGFTAALYLTDAWPTVHRYLSRYDTPLHEFATRVLGLFLYFASKLPFIGMRQLPSLDEYVGWAATSLLPRGRFNGLAPGPVLNFCLHMTVFHGYGRLKERYRERDALLPIRRSCQVPISQRPHFSPSPLPDPATTRRHPSTDGSLPAPALVPVQEPSLGLPHVERHAPERRSQPARLLCLFTHHVSDCWPKGGCLRGAVYPPSLRAWHRDCLFPLRCGVLFHAQAAALATALSLPPQTPLVVCHRRDFRDGTLMCSLAIRIARILFS